MSKKIIFLTKGSKSIALYFRNRKVLHQDGIKPVKIIDTIVCGDCSYGALISSFMNNDNINKDNIYNLNDHIYKNALFKACKVGSKICAIQGSLPIPDIK